MAMPTATLAILSCPGSVACTSISKAACGTSSPSKSLSALATAAGKSLPINMTSCWYGYDDSLKITPVSFTSVPSAGATCTITACAPAFNTFSVSCGSNTWLHPAGPTAPSPAGTSQNIVIDANAGVARTGCACYTPTCGTVCCVSISQLATPIAINSTQTCSGCGSSLGASMCVLWTPASTFPTSGQLCLCFCGTLSTVNDGTTSYGWFCMTCNGASKCCCCFTGALCNSGIPFGPWIYNCGDVYRACVTVCKGCSLCTTNKVNATIGIASITACVVGSYCIGTPLYQTICTC